MREGVGADPSRGMVVAPLVGGGAVPTDPPADTPLRRAS